MWERISYHALLPLLLLSVRGQIGTEWRGEKKNNTLRGNDGEMMRAGVGMSVVWGDGEVGSNCTWLCPQFLPVSGLDHLWFGGCNQPASLTAPCFKVWIGEVMWVDAFQGTHVLLSFLRQWGHACCRLIYSFCWPGPRTATWRTERGEHLSK